MKRRAMFCTDIKKKKRKKMDCDRIADVKRKREKLFPFGHALRVYVIRRITRMWNADIFVSYEAEERRIFVAVIIIIFGIEDSCKGVVRS